MRKDNELYILSNGRVAAVNKKDGSITWEVRLKQYIKAATTFHYGQIMIEGDKLFIGVSGVLLCLSRKDGSLLWKNELKGWGFYYVSMAGAASDETGAAALAASDAATTAAIIS